jgi:tRNA threonylcarbamoyladenosine biosynthesis protein TsaE
MEKLKNMSLRQVQDLAMQMGKKAKSKQIVIGLSGDLGSGKTTFAKSFAKALGISRIKSPTFIVMATYRTRNNTLHHLDLYRLNHIDQLQDLAIQEILSTPKNVVLIEWVDKFQKLEKLCDVIVRFTTKEHNLRDVSIKFN